MIQALTLLGAFGVGIVLSMLGAVKLALAQNLNISDAQVGGLISALMFSCVIGALLAGPLVDALGQKRVIVFGFALCGACILLIANTTSYPVVVAACLLLGVGALCVSTVSSTLAPITLFHGRNPSAAQNLNNVFFGLGAFLIPMLVVYLLQPLGFRGTVSLVALLVLLPVIPALLTTYPPLNTGFQFARAIGLLAKPAILLAGLVLFCYVALEASMAGWITTYLTDLGAGAQQAGTVLSLFWVSIMVSRLAAAILMARSTLLTSRPHHAMFVTAVLTVVSIVCILVIIVAKSTWAGAAAVIVLGLSFGPNFPNVVGITLGRCERSLWGSAFGIVFAIGFRGHDHSGGNRDLLRGQDDSEQHADRIGYGRGAARALGVAMATVCAPVGRHALTTARRAPAPVFAPEVFERAGPASSGCRSNPFDRPRTVQIEMEMGLAMRPGQSERRRS